MTAIILLLCIGALLFIFRRLSMQSFASSSGFVLVTWSSLFLYLHFVVHFPPVFADEITGISYPFLFVASAATYVMGAALAIFIGGKRSSRRVVRSGRGSNAKRMRGQSRTLPTRNAHARGTSLGTQFIVFCIMVGLVCGTLFYGGVPALLKALLNSQLLEMSSLRSDLTKGHYFGGAYSGQGLTKTVMEVCFYLALTVSLATALTRKRFVLPCVLIGTISAVYLAGSGTRWPLVLGAIMAFMVYAQLIQIKAKSLALSALFMFVLLFALTSLGSRYDKTGNILVEVPTAIWERFEYSEGFNTALTLQLIADGRLDHGLGKEHVTQVVNALPGTAGDFPLARQLYLLNNLFPAKEKTTYFSLSYLGILFYDFAVLGALFGFALIGFSLILFDKAVRSTSFNDPLQLGVLSVVGGFLISCNVTSLIDSAVNILVLVILYLLFSIGCIISGNSHLLPKWRFS